jgi:hypothetical protein
MIVRHQDLASAPDAVMAQVFERVGLAMPPGGLHVERQFSLHLRNLGRFGGLSHPDLYSPEEEASNALAAVSPGTRVLLRAARLIFGFLTPRVGGTECGVRRPGG